MTTITDKIAQITMNQAKLAAITEELRRSMAIEELVPDAFAHGRCKVGGRSTDHSPHKGMIYVERGDGARVEFEAMEVPFEIWPTEMQVALSNLPTYRLTPIKKRLRHIQETTQ